MDSCRYCCSSAGAATSSIDVYPQTTAGFQKDSEVLRGAVVNRNRPKENRGSIGKSAAKRAPGNAAVFARSLRSRAFVVSYSQTLTAYLISLLPESSVNRYAIPGLDSVCFKFPVTSSLRSYPPDYRSKDMTFCEQYCMDRTSPLWHGILDPGKIE